MSEVFTATVAYASKEEEYYMVGFADHAYNTEKYIILQKAFEFDDQDARLGMDGEYVEVNGQEKAGYKCCRQAVLTGSSFVIELQDASENDFRVEVNFDGISVTDELKQFMREILGKRVTIP